MTEPYVYTDEQMDTYRVQFERDITADNARGLSTINATEGAVIIEGCKHGRLAAVVKHYLAGPPCVPVQRLLDDAIARGRAAP